MVATLRKKMNNVERDRLDGVAKANEEVMILKYDWMMNQMILANNLSGDFLLVKVVCQYQLVHHPPLLDTRSSHWTVVFGRSGCFGP